MKNLNWDGYSQPDSDRPTLSGEVVCLAWFGENSSDENWESDCEHVTAQAHAISAVLDSEHVAAIWTGDEHDMCVFIQARWERVLEIVRAAERRTRTHDDYTPISPTMERVGNVHPSQSAHLSINCRTLDELN